MADEIKWEWKGERGREKEKASKSATKRGKRRRKRDFTNGNAEVPWTGDRGWNISLCFQPKLKHGVCNELFEVQVRSYCPTSAADLTFCRKVFSSHRWVCYGNVSTYFWPYYVTDVVDFFETVQVKTHIFIRCVVICSCTASHCLHLPLLINRKVVIAFFLQMRHNPFMQVQTCSPKAMTSVPKLSCIPLR